MIFFSFFFTKILHHCKFRVFFPKISCSHAIAIHIHSWQRKGCPWNFSSKHWYFKYLPLVSIHLPFNSFSFTSSVARPWTSLPFNTYTCINSYYMKYIPFYINTMFKNRISFCWNPENCGLSKFSHWFGFFFG